MHPVAGLPHQMGIGLGHQMGVPADHPAHILLPDGGMFLPFRRKQRQYGCHAVFAPSVLDVAVTGGTEYLP